MQTKTTLYIYAIEFKRNDFSLYLNRWIVDTTMSFRGRSVQDNGPHILIMWRSLVVRTLCWWYLFDDLVLWSYTCECLRNQCPKLDNIRIEWSLNINIPIYNLLIHCIISR